MTLIMLVDFKICTSRDTNLLLNKETNLMDFVWISRNGLDFVNFLFGKEDVITKYYITVFPLTWHSCRKTF